MCAEQRHRLSFTKTRMKRGLRNSTGDSHAIYQSRKDDCLLLPIPAFPFRKMNRLIHGCMARFSVSITGVISGMTPCQS